MLEAMKMEHVVAAPASGRLRPGAHRIGNSVAAGAALRPCWKDRGEAVAAEAASVNHDGPRADLARHSRALGGDRR